MEAEDRQELVKAREALRRELNTLYLVSGRWGTTGPLPIIDKLRSLIAEIDELLESKEPPAPTLPRPSRKWPFYEKARCSMKSMVNRCRASASGMNKRLLQFKLRHYPREARLDLRRVTG
jgi:hypothetical protein